MCSNLPKDTTLALLTPKSEIASSQDSIIGGGQIISFLPGKKLVICPPPIIESWQDAISDFGVRSATVVSLGKLEHIKKKGYEEYQYIFVDEAHRFRNENTSQYKLLHEICFGKKVILITATPLNNSIYDFFPLIKLLRNIRV